MTDPEIKPMTPEERRWWRRFCRVLDDQPPGTWLYAHSNGIALMRSGANGEHVTDGDHYGAGLDQAYILNDYEGVVSLGQGDW